MAELAYYTQVVGISESQYKQLSQDGIIMTCLRELEEINREL